MFLTEKIRWYSVIIAACVIVASSTTLSCSVRVLVTRRVPSVELFSYLFKREFKSLGEQSTKQCAIACWKEFRCTDAVLCSHTCHMTGSIVQSWDSQLPDTSNCSILQMNRCNNGELLGEGAYCTCSDGYGGRLCWRKLPETCKNYWQRIPDTNNSDIILNEIKSKQNASCQGRMKIMVDNIRLLNIYDFGKDTHLWAQPRPMYLKDSWNKFSDTTTRQFVTFRYDGLRNVIEYNVNGTMTHNSSSISSLQWIVEKNLEELGTMEDLVKGPETADVVRSDETVFSNSNSSSLTVSLPLYLTRTVDNTNYSHHQFRFGWVDTSGHSMYSFLDIGTNNVFENRIENTIQRRWCFDSCWVKTLGKTDSGKHIYGSVSYLVTAVTHGIPVRVRFGNVSAPAKSLYVRGATVNAIAHIISPMYLGSEQMKEIRMRKTIISTDGSIQTRTELVDTDTILETRISTSEVHWYSDLHRWNRVLSVEANGTKIKGSVPRLYGMIQNGFSVRIGMEYDDGLYHAVEADHLNLGPNGHVSVDVIGHVTVNCSDGSNMRFMPGSYYHNWVSIITTEGTFEKRYYTLGQSVVHSEYVSNVIKFEWFVQF